MNHINAVLAELIADGTIAAEERERMILLSYPRRTAELLAPFARRGRFENLVAKECEVFKVPDPEWAESWLGRFFLAEGKQTRLAMKAVRRN